MKKFCILLALLLLVNLCGCRHVKDMLVDQDEADSSYAKEEDSSREEENDTEFAEAKSAEDVLENTLLALTGKPDAEGVVLGLDGTPAVPSNRGLASLLSSYVTFQVQSFESMDETAVAVVDITAPDAMVLIEQVVAELDDVSDRTALETIMEDLLEEKPVMVTNTVEIRMQLVDDIWCVVPDFALSNALTGGLSQAYQQLQQSIYEGLMEGGDQP